jgi:ATP-dependent Clp protease ATP-binding subunit ClpA
MSRKSLHPEPPSRSAAGDLSALLKRALKDAGLQCIGATDVEGLNALAQRCPRLLEQFRVVHLRPLGAEEIPPQPRVSYPLWNLD